MFKRVSMMLAGVAVAVGLTAVASCRSNLQQSNAATGRPAPSFTAQTITDERIEFPRDFRGKLVLLDFWATWCPPCVAELPHLRAAYEKHHSAGVEFVGISLDGPRGGNVGHVREILKERGVAWKQVLTGAEAIAKQFGVDAIPAAFLVDGESGGILASGDELRGDALEGTLGRFLGRGGGPPSP